MDRLESIKERLNGYIAAQGYANQRTPILVQQRRELLVKFEENVITDMEYLIQRLERYEKALTEIVSIKDEPLLEPECVMASYAKEALKD